jgi:hypothetical protein
MSQVNAGRVWSTVLALLLTMGACDSNHRAADLHSRNTQLRESLLFKYTLDHAAGTQIDWSNNVIRDGSPIRLYFKSKHVAPGYAFCFRYELTDAAGAWSGRHLCNEWYDQEVHSVQVLTAAEAEWLQSVTVHTYDVAGHIDWNGHGDPPSMISHESKIFHFEDAPPPLRASAGDGDADLVGLIHGAAASILLCAHPSGVYKGVRIDDVVATGQYSHVDFTIQYRCTGPMERECSMSLRANFLGDGFDRLSVLSDSALTNAHVGLNACRSILHGR